MSDEMKLFPRSINNDYLKFRKLMEINLREVCAVSSINPPPPPFISMSTARRIEEGLKAYNKAWNRRTE